MSSNLIYEVRYVVADEYSDDFQSELKEHIEVKLGLPGFISADVYAGEVLDKRKEWIAQYSVSSQKDLDEYFSKHANVANQALIDQFGKALKLSGKVLSPAFTKAERICGNCGLHANFQYCANCGQRHQAQIVSLWQLFKDLLGGVFNWDSKVYRTLVPLLTRPGFLTSEYLSGKRAHYTPPLRLYLVLSIIFFLLGGYLVDDGNVSRGNELFNVVEDVETEDPLDSEPAGLGMEINVPDFIDEEAWRYKFEAFMTEMNSEQGKKRFLDDLVGRAPILMLILLPLMAFISKLLHPFSRRYFVEHLLMLVHFHGFVFLFTLLVLLLSKVAVMFELTGFAQWIRIYSVYLTIYYFYKMVRYTLPQSRVMALFRVSVYGLFYIWFLISLLLLAAAFTAMTF